MRAPATTPERRPGQGVGNIVRFNWHFYALALGAALGLGGLAWALPGGWGVAAGVGLTLLLVSTLVSLGVSWYVYDWAGLYRLSWLPEAAPAQVLNLHAGFDETSALLHRRYPAAGLAVLDFYDPVRHTEVSIRRARRAYPPYPGTLAVPTTALPVPSQSTDLAVAFLAAHEIRDPAERVACFRELARALRPGGRLLVTEHLRDWPNFLAYNVGAFHFHSRAAWLRTFAAAGLAVEREVRTTPFVTTFFLQLRAISA